MKRGTTLEAQIQDLNSKGEGVALIEGKATFIKGALPGEQVTIQLEKRRARLDYARVLNLEIVSKERVAPACAHFGTCGGCVLQHLSLDAQIKFKEQQMLKHMAHFGRTMPHTLLPPLRGPSLAYRRKARLGVKYVHKKERVLIGFREQNAHKLTDCSYCHVLKSECAALILPFARLLGGLECKSTIPQIEIAVGDDATAWVLRHMEPLSRPDQNALIDFAKSHHLHLYLQPGNLHSIHKVWPEDDKNYLVYYVPDLQLSMRFHPTDFIQVNGEMNRKMLHLALQLLDLKGSERVLDLFCGLGNFSLALARQAQLVLGVEGAAQMVKRASDNAALNQLENVRFVCSDLTSKVEPTWLEPFDVVVLDPPRTGALEFLSLIQKTKAGKILYISCNPATLARDIGHLVHECGYRLESLGLMDLFPHTHHGEAIALLVKDL